MTKQIDARVPIFFGYFQPMHLGHLSVVKYLLDHNQEVVLGFICVNHLSLEARLEVPQLHPIHHPFNYWERTQIASFGLQSINAARRVFMLPLRYPVHEVDLNAHLLPDTRVWITSLLGEEETIVFSKLVGKGERVHKVPSQACECPGIFSSEIRDKMFLDDKEWQNLLAPSVADYLESIHGRIRVQGLYYLNQEVERVQRLLIRKTSQ